tara:strand:- start:13287 stop:16247 length:2961 start_codon:yes stop_codon:yes gene_type:complete
MHCFSIVFLLSISILISQNIYNHNELNWFTFETDHFLVHYHEETENSAREAAFVAEKVYHPITELYEFKPKNKTHLVLRDAEDYSNGAAYYYDNKIVIWSTPLEFELRGSHRWLQNVITHEFAHIISLQKAMKSGTRVPGAYLQWINYEKEKRPDVLYGYPNTLISYPIPGTVVPPWFAEGIAQYMYDKANYDHWDTHRDMILRDRVLNDKIFSFKEINTFGKKGIGNESIYNIGFAFSKYIAEKYGEQSFKNILNELSHPFQFSISKSIGNATGVEGDLLYNEFVENVIERYKLLSEPIMVNTIDGFQLIKDGIANLYPKWRPGQNSFIYLSSKENDYFSQTDLYFYDIDKNKDEKLISSVSYAPTWDTKGGIVYYSKKATIPNKNGSKFYDIYAYNFEDKNETRITHDQRAYNPIFIKSDSSLGFISTFDGSQNIFKYSLSEKSIERLTNFNDRSIISYISYDEIKDKIIFDRTTHHYRDIGEIDLATRSISMVLNDPLYDERNMVVGNSKMRIHSDDKTGIYNLFMENHSDSTYGYITNVVGGAFMPDVNDKNQIVFSLYQDGAYTISLLDSIVIIENELIGYSEDYFKANANMESVIVEKIENISTTYEDQFPEMFLMPKVMFDYGTIKPGFYFQSGEIIDRLSLFGGASTNSLKDFDLNFIFEYRRFYPTLFFETYYVTRNTSDSSRYRDAYNVFDDITFRMTEFRTGLKIPFKGTSIEVAGSRQIYRAIINQGIPTERIKGGSAYDYYRGWHLTAKWELNMIKRRIDRNINPSKGWLVWSEIRIENNKFIEDVNLSEAGTLLEEFNNNNLIRLEGGGVFHYELPWRKRWVTSIKAETGWMSNDSADSFFYFYLGGMPGLKGYPFYSIQGTKKILAELSFRVPVFSQKQIDLLPINIQNCTIATVFQFGDSWVNDNKFSWKKSVGIQWRLNGYSFYNFPTAIEAEVYQPLNIVKVRSDYEPEQVTKYDKEPRFYFKVLFEF